MCPRTFRKKSKLRHRDLFHQRINLVHSVIVARPRIRRERSCAKTDNAHLHRPLGRQIANRPSNARTRAEVRRCYALVLRPKKLFAMVDGAVPEQTNRSHAAAMLIEDG